jgi:D-proline reductase (dithiol) PrdB
MRTGCLGRYRGFAQVEYEYVRQRVYASFDWRTFEEPSPSHRVERPLERSRIALVASAGAHLPEQPAFDLGKRGDSSYRELPSDATELRFAHAGYDTRRADEDPDVVFPLSLLRRLALAGDIGELAPRAFSFMGYIPETEPLLQQTGPEVARKLLADAVDLVLLVPS